MPEIPGSECCPVRCFEKYINKLHPSCDRLWQRPKDEFDDSDDSSYCNAPLGKEY